MQLAATRRRIDFCAKPARAAKTAAIARCHLFDDRQDLAGPPDFGPREMAHGVGQGQEPADRALDPVALVGSRLRESL